MKTKNNKNMENWRRESLILRKWKLALLLNKKIELYRTPESLVALDNEGNIILNYILDTKELYVDIWIIRSYWSQKEVFEKLIGCEISEIHGEYDVEEVSKFSKKAFIKLKKSLETFTRQQILEFQEVTDDYIVLYERQTHKNLI